MASSASDAARCLRAYSFQPCRRKHNDRLAFASCSGWEVLTQPDASRAAQCAREFARRDAETGAPTGPPKGRGRESNRHRRVAESMPAIVVSYLCSVRRSFLPVCCAWPTSGAARRASGPRTGVSWCSRCRAGWHHASRWSSRTASVGARLTRANRAILRAGVPQSRCPGD